MSTSKNTRSLRVNVGPLYSSKSSNDEHPSVFLGATATKLQLGFSYAMALALLWNEKSIEQYEGLTNSKDFSKLVMEFCLANGMSLAEIQEILVVTKSLIGGSEPDMAKVLRDFGPQFGSIVLSKCCYAGKN